MGWRALAQSRRTLPGVSSPASVVRSIMVMARRSQAACQSFLMLRRVVRDWARRWVALRLTRVARTQPISSGMPGLRFCLSTAIGPSVPLVIESFASYVCRVGLKLSLSSV